MNETEIRALAADVLAGIAPEADLATVGDDEDLRAALDLDSMDFMNFVIGLHQRTGIDIPAFLALRAKVAGWLEGEQTNGSMWRAGLPKNFQPVGVSKHSIPSASATTSTAALVGIDRATPASPRA